MNQCRFGFAVGLALLFALVGSCEKASKDTTHDGARPPAELIVTVSCGDTEALLTQIGGIADSVKPGASAMISPLALRFALAPVLGADSIEGIDLAKPAWVLVLDPKKHERPLVLVGSVSDKTKVVAGESGAVRIGGGYAVVGPKDLVGVVGDYAVGTLVKSAPPPHLTGTLHVPAVLALYGEELTNGMKELEAEMAKGGAGASPEMTKFLKAYVNGIMKVSRMTDRVSISVGLVNDALELDVAMAALPGTGLAEFLAAQKPMPPGLLARLPAGESMMVAAGHFELGAAREPMLAFLDEIFPPDAGKPSAMRDFMGLLDGDFAFNGNFSLGQGMSMVAYYGVTDSKKAMTSLLDMMSSMITATSRLSGMEVKVDVAADAMVVDGIPVTKLEQRFVSVPAETREMIEKMYGDHLTSYYAPVDGWLVFFMGPAAEANLESSIKALRAGGNPLSATAKHATAAARPGDSMLGAVDVGMMMSGMGGGQLPSLPFFFAFASEGATGHLRMSMPLSAIKQMAMQGAAP